MLIFFHSEKCAGGTELKVLLSPLALELIRAAVMVAGVCLLFLIYFLI